MSTYAPQHRVIGPSLENVDPHTVTISGLALDAVYSAANPAESLQNLQRDIAAPGQYPFTRGLFPEGYRTRLWTMRQFAGFGSADDTNKRFKYLLEQAKMAGGKVQANTGLSTAFDLPTLMGRDSDDPLSVGEVGRCGVAIDTIEDMHRLYADIPVDKVTVSQTINGPAAVIWAMYLAMAKQRNIGWDTLGGTLQNDILKEFHSQNEFIFPPEASVKLVVDTIEFQSRNCPKWNSVSISGYHIREAGSTAVQELAFTLRDGMEYVEACIERGLPIDEFAPRLSYFFNSHNEFFEEICKLRAARRIWACMMKERYARRTAPVVHEDARADRRLLPQQQPLTTSSASPTGDGRRWADASPSTPTRWIDRLPTEQAVRRPPHAADPPTRPASPAPSIPGGSWFIEELTDKWKRVSIDRRSTGWERWECQMAHGQGPKSERHRGATLWFEVPSGNLLPPRHGPAFATAAPSSPASTRATSAADEASYRFSEEWANDRIVGVNAFTEGSDEPPSTSCRSPTASRPTSVAPAAFKQPRFQGRVPPSMPSASCPALTKRHARARRCALANCTLGEWFRPWPMSTGGTAAVRSGEVRHRASAR